MEIWSVFSGLGEASLFFDRCFGHHGKGEQNGRGGGSGKEGDIGIHGNIRAR